MKTINTLICLLISLVAFSQEKKSVSSGYITFNSGSTLYFKNLTLDSHTVEFYNEMSKKTMNFSVAAVKKIVDNTGVIIYLSATEKISDSLANKEKGESRNKTEAEKVVYISSGKLMMNGKRLANSEIEAILKPYDMYDTYKEGKSNALFGKILIGGGIGLFIGGGISNLIKSNNTSPDYSGKAGKKGGPALLITGIGVSLIGISIKISDNNKIKKTLQEYNSLPASNTLSCNKTEFKVVAGSAGVGFQFNF